MTLVASQTERLTFGSINVEAGEAIPLLPIAIEHHSQLGSLVIASRVDQSGNPLYLEPAVPCDGYPDPPTDEEKAADPKAADRYTEACIAYAAAIKEPRKPRVVPAFLGRLVVSPVPSNFFIRNIHTNVPRLVAYPGAGNTVLYHLRQATIVD